MDLPINVGPPTIEEISVAIKQMKSGKAAGPDNIPAEALKADVAVTAKILHIVFNKIWDEEKVSKDWKERLLTSTSEGKHGIQWTSRMQLDDLDFVDDLALLSQSQQQMQAKTSSTAAASAAVGLNIHKGKKLLYPTWLGLHQGSREALYCDSVGRLTSSSVREEKCGIDLGYWGQTRQNLSIEKLGIPVPRPFVCLESCTKKNVDESIECP
ncbi:unnamed protein product [Schistosoma curassoni]|uniref:F-box family protein n=1 Tax=Schistosoma curassoni TaxID=6186 RepID=A0A183KLB0_9TREM|nr:unnamed protein product [Schistosoma curassoni]